MRKQCFIALATSMALWLSDACSADITKDDIIAQADAIADAQLKALGNNTFMDWTWGVMEIGYAEFAQVSPKGNAYIHALLNRASHVQWTPHLSSRHPYNADDTCIGQTFLALYALHPDPQHLEPVKRRMDALVDHLNATESQELTFSWCDALFMAPPLLSRMSAITGDRKYIDAMDREYWRTTAQLYDSKEHLFYRDASFIGKADARGQKIFWSRGNGWVLASLARVLHYMPKDYPSRRKYEKLFKDMAAKVITLRRSDGTWPPSLLDATLFDTPETSGTALFTYALAWGVHHHLLDRATYLPVIENAWNALIALRRADGLPGYCQPPDVQPAAVSAEDTQIYASGAYLLAATELYMLTTLPGGGAPDLYGHISHPAAATQ